LLQSCGLPPISELEAQALEINTSDLYNELAGLAWEGSAPNVDFCAGNTGVTGNNLQHTHSEGTGDDFIELDDLLAPGETFSFDEANDQFLLYPLDQPTYNGNYDFGSSLSAFDANGSLPPLPSSFYNVPPVSNNLASSICLNPALKGPFS
jgi:hypothetical protein